MHVPNSQNYNRYSYVLNNPLKYTDPTGNAPASAGYYFQARAMEALGISHLDFYNSITAFLNTEKDDSWLQTFTTAGGTVAEVGMGDGGDDPKKKAEAVKVEYINWSMIMKGSMTVIAGSISTGAGVATLLTGAGAPIGTLGIITGVPAIGLGASNIIAGLQGRTTELPSGLFEAVDIGFKGNGSTGQVLDVFSGGWPKSTRDGLIFGYGIYNTNVFKSIISPQVKISTELKPYPTVIHKDNTNVIIPKYKK